MTVISARNLGKVILTSLSDDVNRRVFSAMISEYKKKKKGDTIFESMKRGDISERKR